MKRIATIFMTILYSVFAVFVPVSAYADSNADMPVAYYGTAKIDGIKDSCYTDEHQLHTGNVLKISTIQDGTRAKVWLAWDYEALYVYAEADETTPSSVGTDEYLKDSVEIFIDEDNSKSEVVDNNDGQYRVTIIGSRSTGMSADENFSAAAVSNANGTYNVEMKIVWRDILPADGSVIGLDCQVNDANADGKRVSVVTWYSELTTNYVNALNYGNVELRLGDHAETWNGTDPLKISVNGYRVDCGETPPVVIQDRTFVPMRSIFELLGADVAWNDAEQAAYVIGNGNLMIIPIGSHTTLLNGKPVELDVPAQLINDRTMVPVRFVSEMLGAEVQYNEDLGAIHIKNNEAYIN